MRRIHAGRIIALVALVALSAMAVQTLYKPYREKLTHGIVDWDQGWIRADASVPLKTGVPAAQARVQAEGSGDEAPGGSARWRSAFHDSESRLNHTKR